MAASKDHKELKIDWLTVLFYTIFVVFGLMNIYASSNKAGDLSLNLNASYGKQFVWICVAALLGVVILYTDTKFIEFFSYGAYGITLLLVILVTLFGTEVNGAKSWFNIGPFRLQPSEFMKIGTALAVAHYMSDHSFSFKRLRDRLTVIAIIVVPALLIIQQRDTGTALAFGAFLFMFFREGMHPLYAVGMLLVGIFAVLALVLNVVLIIGVIAGLTIFAFYVLFDQKYVTLHILVAIGFSVLVLSANLLVNNVLQKHQRDRIQALLDPSFDPTGINYATTQSKIAIGSGGLTGKGFMKGTQTKFDFVPQQDTDYIFCTIGEEYGWAGSAALLLLYLAFIAQLLYISENSRSSFARIYGYSIVGFFFVHIAINIGMTIGLAPVIGIPLPFFSYGGSAMLSFSAMLFILLNLYAQRVNVLKSK